MVEDVELKVLRWRDNVGRTRVIKAYHKKKGEEDPTDNEGLPEPIESYVDKRMRPLEFVVGDRVFFRVTPTIRMRRAIQ